MEDGVQDLNPTASNVSLTSLLDRRGFLLSSAVFVVCVGTPFLIFVGGKAARPYPFSCAAAGCPGADPGTSWLIGFTWIALISCAALFGALGVMISIVLRRTVYPVSAATGIWKALFLFYSLGSVLAIILLALFLGGFLQGNLFPDFRSVGSWSELNVRVQDWAKIIVWCFLAGFSERLVPTLFDQLVFRALASDDDKASHASKTAK